MCFSYLCGQFLHWKVIPKSQSTEKCWNHNFCTARPKMLYLRNSLMLFSPTRGFQRSEEHCSLRWLQGLRAALPGGASWSEHRYLHQFPSLERIVLKAKICTVRRGEKSLSPERKGVISVSGENADIRDISVLKIWGSSPGDSPWQTGAAFPSSRLLSGATARGGFEAIYY